MEATSMSTDRGMDKEDVVQIYNGILLSHKKEQNNAICSDMDGPRDCDTKWSQTEKDKLSYDIAQMWNLKKNDANELTKQTHRLRKESIDWREGWGRKE